MTYGPVSHSAAETSTLVSPNQTFDEANGETEMSDETNGTRLGKLRELTTIQRASGNWNCDAYMHGMANGMELALAMMEDREPNYLEAPAQWLSDLPKPYPKCGQRDDAA